MVMRMGIDQWMNDLIGRIKEWKFHDRVQGCAWIKI
jgi:hypothetical protein